MTEKTSRAGGAVSPWRRLNLRRNPFGEPPAEEAGDLVVLPATVELGEVTFEVEPRLLRSGDEVGIDVFCQPKEETELRAAVVRLQAEEQVVRGSGTNKTTFKEVVYEETREIAPGRSLPAGLPFQAQGTVPIPAGAPTSFIAHDNQLQWTVSLRLDVARWPDWVEERTILVHP